MQIWPYLPRLSADAPSIDATIKREPEDFVVEEVPVEPPPPPLTSATTISPPDPIVTCVGAGAWQQQQEAVEVKEAIQEQLLHPQVELVVGPEKIQVKLVLQELQIKDLLEDRQAHQVLVVLAEAVLVQLELLPLQRMKRAKLVVQV